MLRTLMKAKGFAAGVLVSASLIMASSANALQYNFLYSGVNVTDPFDVYSVNLQFNTGAANGDPGFFNVTSIAGQVVGAIDAGAIIGMLGGNPMTIPATSPGGFAYDNLANPTGNPVVTEYGLLFNTSGSGNEWNLYSTGVGAYSLDHYSGVPNVYDVSTVGGMTVTPVPEAESYAMMLAGLGLIGFVVRRRTRNGMPN